MCCLGVVQNWFHLKDGTAFLGKNDIVITSEQEFKIGEKATFEGLLSLDKDFGSGYFFEVILENAARVEIGEK